jgi:hypothetical protein
MNYPYTQVILDGSIIPEQTQTSVFVERTEVNRPISPCTPDLPAGFLQSESSPHLLWARTWQKEGRIQIITRAARPTRKKGR